MNTVVCNSAFPCYCLSRNEIKEEAMPRAQALRHLTECPQEMFEASIRTFASHAVAELAKTHRLDPIRTEAYEAWVTHRLLADFNAQRASEIATENKFDEALLAQALDSFLEKERFAENADA